MESFAKLFIFMTTISFFLIDKLFHFAIFQNNISIFIYLEKHDIYL